MVKNNFPI